MSCIAFLIQFFGLLTMVNAFHFLGGTITWHPLDKSATGTPVGIVITQTYSWLYSRITCTDAMIAANQLIPVGIYTNLLSQTLDCVENCGNGSIGYVAPSIVPYCTDISAPIGTTASQRSDTVYLAADDDFSVAFQSGGWRPLTLSGAGPPWSISTHIITQTRSDNGLYNSAPVATVMSPIYIPVNTSTVFNVPVADADGDPTRCRWSVNGTVDECGGVCPPGSLPPNTTIYSNCTIVITGQNIGDWYAVAIMIEDFISASSTTPLSSVPVQFLVQVVGPPTCTVAPKIMGKPAEQSCTIVAVGETFTSELVAVNSCGENVTIVDIATLSFPGMVKGNITELDETTYYCTISWTPTAAQLGYQVMCAMAFDSENSQSPQYCFKFFVSETAICSCPGDACLSTTTANTSTNKKKSDFTFWPLIGGIIFLTLLGAIGWFSYLWFRCCWLASGGCKRHKYTGICEFYHIEQCIDPDCHCQNKPNSALGSFLSYAETQNSPSDSTSSIQLCKAQPDRTVMTVETTNEKQQMNIHDEEANEEVKDFLVMQSTNENSEKFHEEKRQRRHRHHSNKHGMRVIRIHPNESSVMHQALVNTRHLSTVKHSIVPSDYYKPFKQTSKVAKDRSPVKHAHLVDQKTSFHSMPKSLISNTNSTMPLLTIPHIEHSHTEKKIKSNKTAHSLDAVIKTKSENNKH